MAPARVRGCAGPQYSPGVLWAEQTDASRRRNGPRKPTFCRVITVRLRSKSCPAGGSDIRRHGRRAVVAQAARLSAGDCGVEDQVGRAGAPHEAETPGTTGSRLSVISTEKGGSTWTSS